MMENTGNMEMFTLDEMLDKHIGKVGTPNRDAFESRVEDALDEYYLGQSIKDARESRNLTQEELGNMVGVQKAQISRLERGRSISYPTLKRIFKALNMRVSLQTELGTYPIV